MSAAQLEIPETIETKRLVLRVPRVDDGAGLASAIQASLPELAPWLPWATETYGAADGEAWCRRAMARFILREGASYLIFDRADEGPLGGVGADWINWNVRKSEIGYWLRSDRAGRGIMTEAVTALATMLRSLDVRRVQILCDEDNVRSAAVARRCGFDHEGTLRADSLAPDGTSRSTMIFAWVEGPAGARIGDLPASQTVPQGVQSSA